MNDMTTMARTQERRPRTWLRMALMLVLVGLVAGGLVAMHNFKTMFIQHIVANIRAQLPTVATTKATLETWQPAEIATGSARASKGADIAAEVAGVVDRIDFTSGQDVNAGAELLRLRPNDDHAKLAQLEANAQLAAITLARDERQLAARAIAQATVDTDRANLKVAQATVAAQKAVMAEKVVRAPFSGRLGLRQVDVGQYLAPGTTIVSLQKLDPMLVDFYLPQQAVGRVKVGQKVEVTTDAYPNRTFPGTIRALAANIDPASRMLQVRASIPNPGKALLPGMYLNVKVESGAPRKLVTIPLAAVAFNPYGSLVYVVHHETPAQGKPKTVVEQQFVSTGAQRGDQVSILKGLKAGDEVVTAGQLKLHNGSAVAINNAVQPSNNPAPKPVDQ